MILGLPIGMGIQLDTVDMGSMIDDIVADLDGERDELDEGIYRENVFLIRPDWSMKRLSSAYVWSKTWDDNFLIDLPHDELPDDPSAVLPDDYGVAINWGERNELVGQIVDVGAEDGVGGRTTVVVDPVDFRPSSL